MRLEFAANAGSGSGRRSRSASGSNRRTSTGNRRRAHYTSLFQIAGLDVTASAMRRGRPTPVRLSGDAGILTSSTRVICSSITMRQLRHHHRAIHQHGRRRLAHRRHQDDGVSGGRRHAVRQSLIRAAEAGKQVACVIELKARSTKSETCTGRGARTGGAHVTVGT